MNPMSFKYILLQTLSYYQAFYRKQIYRHTICIKQFSSNLKTGNSVFILRCSIDGEGTFVSILFYFIYFRKFSNSSTSLLKLTRLSMSTCSTFKRFSDHAFIETLRLWHIEHALRLLRRPPCIRRLSRYLSLISPIIILFFLFVVR